MIMFLHEMLNRMQRLIDRDREAWPIYARLNFANPPSTRRLKPRRVGLSLRYRKRGMAVKYQFRAVTDDLSLWT